MKTENLEIELKDGVCPWRVIDHLNKYKALKASVVKVTPGTIRVWFDENEVQSKLILKLVAASTNPKGRGKKATVVNARRIDPGQKAA